MNTTNGKTLRYVLAACAMALLMTWTGAPTAAERPAVDGGAMPPVAWQPTGARITWRGVSFIVPPGMSGENKTEFYEMGGLGISGRLGVCAIWILGETPAHGDLAMQAHGILVAVTTTVLRRGVADSQGGGNLIGERRVGRSAEGWRYVELNGILTEGSGGRARIMLIDRGTTVVPIVAISARNGCVSLTHEVNAEPNTITWAAFYYSLRLPGATPSYHLRQQIVGRWQNFAVSTGGAGALHDAVYSPNGRYGSGALGASEWGQQLASYAGEGRYVVDGDKLAVFPNAGTPEVHLIRIVEDYDVKMPSKSTLRLCKVKADDVLPYEICLSRN